MITIPRLFLVPLLGATLFLARANAGTITVSFDSNGFVLQNEMSATLSGGLPNVNGDGVVLQLGYYVGATAGNLFPDGATWVPLTGEGSANTANITGYGITFNATTIGDVATADFPGIDGEYYESVTFDDADPTKNQGLAGLIAGTTPLAIRFYNAATLGAATFYNAISSSNAAWLWQAPAGVGPSLSLQLGGSGQVSESFAEGQSAGNNLKTTLAVVPEPSSIALALVGVVGLATARRRRRTA